MPDRTESEHKEHTKHASHYHKTQEEQESEAPEKRAVGEFVEPGEEVKPHPPVGGPGGEGTMPIGNPVRSITPEHREDKP